MGKKSMVVFVCLVFCLGFFGCDNSNPNEEENEFETNQDDSESDVQDEWSDPECSTDGVCRCSSTPVPFCYGNYAEAYVFCGKRTPTDSDLNDLPYVDLENCISPSNLDYDNGELLSFGSISDDPMCNSTPDDVRSGSYVCKKIITCDENEICTEGKAAFLTCHKYC